MTTTYEATVTREDGWWMIHIPKIDGLTQSRRLTDADRMARELVAVTLDVPPDTVDVHLIIAQVAGIDVRMVLSTVAAERAEAARLEADATTRARALARALVADDVPLRDIGTILGVSHQRAHQLASA